MPRWGKHFREDLPIAFGRNNGPSAKQPVVETFLSIAKRPSNVKIGRRNKAIQ